MKVSQTTYTNMGKHQIEVMSVQSLEVGNSWNVKQRRVKEGRALGDEIQGYLK